MRFAVPGLRTGSLLASTLVLAACGHAKPSLPDFADLVEQVSPSVVNISAVPLAPEGEEHAGDSRGQMPDWLRKFLEKHGQNPDGGSATPDDGGDNGDGGDGQGADPGEQSLGSGFILWEDGYILTNQHVVKDAREVVVRLSDRRQLPAQVVGSDERSDLALLKIDATSLPAVKLADVSRTRVGQWVVAIGSPFGFDYTVTAGIVSAKGRGLDTEQYVPFIQTDAAVNPGNSGGPLFNLQGEVVGVNSQIYSQTGGFMGVAFAIPIDVAAKVARELRDKGKVTRGYLGVMMQEVDRKLAESFRLPKPEGALVARVLPDSPAAQAGVKTGDVILKYNGVEVVSSRTLPPLVGESSPGDTVTLEILREGKPLTIKIEVGTLDTQDQNPDGTPPSTVEPGQAPEAVPPSDPDKPLGLSIKPLSDDERRSAKVVSGGVRVASVSPGAGREAGVLPGDVVLSVAGQEVDSVARFQEVAGRLTPGQTVPMLVQRDGAPLFLALAVPPKP